MDDCKVIKIITPNKYELDGLWFGPDKADQVWVFVHGLSGSTFGHHKLLTPLAGTCTAVLFFNNRGSGKVSRIKKINKRLKKGYKSVYIGESHEVFTDCVDDIQGVINTIRTKTSGEIFLVGHSTGCQKSIFYLSRKGKQKLIKGVVLLAPMSDYAAALKLDGVEVLNKAEKIAKRMVASGKPHEMLPGSAWPAMHDAQRWLSLYTPNSEEEIFSYVQPDKTPATLRKVKTPTLVIFAGNDEYRDRPNKQLVKWFERNIKAKQKKIVVIEKAPHSFYKFEDQVSEEIRNWVER